MSDHVTPHDGNEGTWIVELIVAAVVIYFARRAAPMLSYYERLGVGERMWERADGILESAFALVMMWNTEALSFITLAIPALIFLKRGSQNSFESVGVGLLLMGALGWYIGKEFAKAFARKAACQSDSFWGFGCVLEGEPFMTFMIFSFVAVCIGALSGLTLVAIGLEKIFGSEATGADKA